MHAYWYIKDNDVWWKLERQIIFYKSKFGIIQKKYRTRNTLHVPKAMP